MEMQSSNAAIYLLMGHILIGIFSMGWSIVRTSSKKDIDT